MTLQASLGKKRLVALELSTLIRNFQQNDVRYMNQWCHHLDFFLR